MSAALVLSDVWKAYPDWAGQPRTLRGAFARRVPLLRTKDSPRRWALREVSLELAAGHSLGLIGHNGAGKSTLLRLASGLGRPTRGRVAVHPDTASVLNLGAAFDLQLTGRENALTAALVAGLTRGEAARALPAMLDFSELEDFIDSPMRTYSEGMKLRLAFSVMAGLEPRVLVLDEVLSVGDLSFQQRCQERIAELRASGTSLVLASHSAEEVASTCEQVLWLHRGAPRALGDADTVLAEYEAAVHETSLARTPVGAGPAENGLTLGENRFGSQEMVVEEVRLAPGTVRSGDALRVAVRVAARDDAIADPIVGVSIRRRFDDVIVLDLSSRAGGFTLGREVREATVELSIERLDLPAGAYAVDVGVYEQAWEYAYDFHYAAYELQVEGPSGGKGLLAPPHRWSRAG